MEKKSRPEAQNSMRVLKRKFIGAKHQNLEAVLEGVS